jgi:hypothetical protein
MKTLPSTRNLLRVTLCFLALGCRVWAGDDFFDDFSDGDARDGSPVNWKQLERVYAPNAYSLTEQGLEFSDGIAVPANSAGTDYVYGDVSVTARIRRTGNSPGPHQWWIWNEGDYFAISVRGQDGPADDCYWAVVNWYGDLQLGTSSGWTKTMQEVDLSPLNVSEQDLVLRLDAVGDKIHARCWAAGEPMPETPQLTMTDTRYTTGSVGLLGGNDPGANWFVRSVEVISHDPKPEPVVDFNGNGQVDIEDLTKLIESWGQDAPAVDIVPDGVVDTQDLEILMSYWQLEVNDVTLQACWKLDEIEGNIAYDSSPAENDALVMGNAQWQPDAGQVGGALQFDGIDDYIVTAPLINPVQDVFSIFTWVKGGGPGQVVMSQEDGAGWLLSDAQGCLKCALKSGGRNGGPLGTDMMITDGNWHRIGLTWDGTNRVLYVDGLEVGLDTPSGLAASEGRFNIGTGKILEPTSFWSGMIDDVRIYDRVVKP